MDQYTLMLIIVVVTVIATTLTRWQHRIEQENLQRLEQQQRDAIKGKHSK